MTPIKDLEQQPEHDQSTGDTQVDEDVLKKYEVLPEGSPGSQGEHSHQTHRDGTENGGGFVANLLRVIDNKLVENFLPQYFANVMATGISAAIMYRFPFPAHWLQVTGIIMWAVGIFFFIAGCFFLVAACIKYPKNFVKFHTDPKVAPFMGCFAMGYNSLVNLLYFITTDEWIVGIFVLWCLSVFFCLYTACVIFYYTFLVKSRNSYYFSPENLQATLLLPIVALTVTSSSGQLIVMDLPTVNLQVVTILISFVLWANAIAMSFIILTLVIYKYVVHKVPNTTMVFTTFIPIGFLGQGAFSVLLCGHNLHQLVLQNSGKLARMPFVGVDSDLGHTGMIIADGCLLICSFFGIFLISFGYFNTVVAVATVLSKVITKNPNPNHCVLYESGLRRMLNGLIKFNKGFWAMTFPLGTMAIGNAEFGEMFDLLTFKVVGAIYGVATVLATTGCCVGFLYHAYQDVVKCWNARG